MPNRQQVNASDEGLTTASWCLSIYSPWPFHNAFYSKISGLSFRCTITGHLPGRSVFRRWSPLNHVGILVLICEVLWIKSPDFKSEDETWFHHQMSVNKTEKERVPFGISQFLTSCNTLGKVLPGSECAGQLFPFPVGENIWLKRFRLPLCVQRSFGLVEPFQAFAQYHKMAMNASRSDKTWSPVCFLVFPGETLRNNSIKIFR